MLRPVPFIILSVVAGLLSYQLFGPDGAWFHEQDLRRDLAEQNRANEKQRLRNEELRAELASLENGTEAIEERARRDLYMVKEGEVLFRLETPEEYERRQTERASLPDYSNPSARAGQGRAFSAKKMDLYTRHRR